MPRVFFAIFLQKAVAKIHFLISPSSEAILSDAKKATDSTAVYTYLTAPRPTDACWYWFYTRGDSTQEVTLIVKSPLSRDKKSLSTTTRRPVRPHNNHGIRDEKGTSIAPSRDGCLYEHPSLDRVHGCYLRLGSHGWCDVTLNWYQK
jgi:hypothetical protein